MISDNEKKAMWKQLIKELREINCSLKEILKRTDPQSYVTTAHTFADSAVQEELTE